jgi:hypothetical protein
MRWIEWTAREPDEVERQPNGRWRHWKFIADAGKNLRVVLSANRKRVLTVFWDRDK